MALASDDIAGVEALVRWEKPGFEVLMPGQFLPGIGRAGLTLELGAEIVEHSLSAWKRSLRTLNAESPSTTLAPVIRTCLNFTNFPSIL